MISIGEKLTIVFPAAFFYFTFIMNVLEGRALNKEITSELKETDISKNINQLIVLSTIKKVFLEFVIVSLANGLSIMIVLGQNELGIISLFSGVALGIYGRQLVDLCTTIVDTTYKKIQLTLLITTSLSFTHIGYFLFYDAYVYLSIPKIYITIGSFIVYFILGIIIHKKILPKLAV